jgi:hypothetical protein
MHAVIEHIGEDLLCRSEAGVARELRLDGAAARTVLEAWAARYNTAVRSGADAELLAIGRAIFDWLDANGWASSWAKGIGPRLLEVRVDDPGEPLARAMLDAPWELLARKDGYLADDAVQVFELTRRIGVEDEPVVPQFSDLQLMFMAAAPQGEQVLAFEEEEAAILAATAGLPIHLVVEESGAARFLGHRLDLDGPFEALLQHLVAGNVVPDRETLGQAQVGAGIEQHALGPGVDRHVRRRRRRLCGARGDRQGGQAGGRRQG